MDDPPSITASSKRRVQTTARRTAKNLTSATRRFRQGLAIPTIIRPCQNCNVASLTALSQGGNVYKDR